MFHVAGWRIDETVGRSEAHELVYCSQGKMGEPASHFGKLFVGSGACWDFSYFQRQAAVAVSIEHPGVLPLVAHELEGKRPLLVYPRIRASRLDDWLASQAQIPLAPVVFSMARQVLEALEAIHRAGYVHGGLRPEHVLVGVEGGITLIGLGNTEPIGQHTSLPRWNTQYDPPETWSEEFEASSAQDVFSAGRLLTELIGTDFGDSPIARAMCASSPEGRPTTAELVQLFREFEAEAFGQAMSSDRPTCGQPARAA